jgi:lysozyme
VKRWVLGGLGALALLCTGLAVVVWPLMQELPELEQYPIRGLDLSHHQGEIDWYALGGHATHQFVWIKATEGGDWVDSRFAENWEGVRTTEMVPGAYHFFTFCTPAAEQLENFLGQLPAPDGPRLPSVVDVEVEGNCSERPTPEVLVAELRLFSQGVEDATGQRPMVYTTHKLATQDLRPLFEEDGHSLWVRSIHKVPTDDWVIWQYQARGQVEGIEGWVDENAFAGSAQEFEDWVGSSPTKPVP